MTEGQGITTHKFVVALNKKCATGIVMNAAAHMALGLVSMATAEQKEQMRFLSFVDASGQEHSNISALSLIIMRGKNGELRRLRQEARAAGLLCVDFTETMTGNTFIEQLERTKNTPEDQMNYYGVAVFGEKGAVDPLTKRLSLWRDEVFV